MTEREFLKKNCSKAELDADVPTATCWSEQTRIWQRRVDKEYRAALKRVDPEMRQYLGRAQTAWKKYAEAQCSLWADVRGTLSSRLTSLCELNIYRNRAYELSKIDGLSG